ncbi:MAG TPA: type II toxin-antitoxin system prevent-host-death family antitoxin [Planctomycetaceae bacterium]|nr:type II toxin-antitoxin system prevent-host-death family antitoxin [Planctomycetaceae bacterium]
MRTTTASKLRSELGSYLQQTEPVMVTQNGRMKAVLVPVESEDEAERWVMANNAELMKLLDAASRRVKKTGGIPSEEFWKRIDAKYEKKANGRHKRKAGK